jgi:REP element-mobilizing transposase RayT
LAFLRGGMTAWALQAAIASWHSRVSLAPAEMGVSIEKGVLSSVHVHIFVSIPQHLALSTVMPRIKGRSSRKIQMEFSDLRKRYWGRRFYLSGM